MAHLERLPCPRAGRSIDRHLRTFLVQFRDHLRTEEAFHGSPTQCANRIWWAGRIQWRYDNGGQRSAWRNSPKGPFECPWAPASIL